MAHASSVADFIYDEERALCICPAGNRLYQTGRDMLFKHASIFNSAIESDMFEQRAGLKFDEKWLEERQKRQQR